MRPFLLPMLLSDSAKRYPTKIAIYEQTRSLTYHELEQQSNHLAHALKITGLQKGDRVLIQLGNSIDAVITFWAVLKADGIASMVSEEMADEKFIYLLKDSAASMVFSNQITDKENILAHLTTEKIIVTHAHAKNNHPNIYPLDTLLSLANTDTALTYQAISLDLATIIYTSGSTGDPKGVMLTHDNMLAAENSINAYLHYQHEDVVLSALPLYFDYGLYQMILSFSVGATVILEPSFTWPTIYCQKIASYSATILPLLPSMLTFLHRTMRKKPKQFLQVKKVTNTGAALTEKHIAIVNELFPQAQLYSMYGLTECKRCCYLPPEELAYKPNSVGKAIPNSQWWVVDEHGNHLAPGQIGQLVIRSPMIMQGYWNKTEETNRCLRFDPQLNEKVLYTGDYVEYDQDGYLYIKGRIDEIIKVRGIKVSPKTIEDTISQYAAVSEVAALGINNEHNDTEIWTFITFDEQKEKDISQLRKYCQRHLTAEQMPARIKIMQELPRKPNGKLNKLMLHKMALSLLGECDGWH